MSSNSPNISDEWKSRIYQKHPVLLEMHERSRCILPHNSFSSLALDDVSQTEAREGITRVDMLQMIYRYFKSKGMEKTLKQMEEETGIRWDGRMGSDLTGLVALGSEAMEKDEEDPEIQTASIYQHFIADKEMVEMIETNIWEEGEDQENVNVIFDKGELQSATLNKLVERITCKAVNTEYRKTFMETYRSFVSPDTLLLKLIERYNVPRTVDKTERTIIKSRVAQLLKIWIKDFYYDWNESMLRMLEHFMEDHLRKENPRFINALRLNCDKLRRGDLDRGSVDYTIKLNLQKPIVKLEDIIRFEELDIYDLDVEEIARQLSITEYNIYKKIRSHELLNQAWNNPALRHRSPNVLKMIQRFNSISEWVSNQVVSPESLADRIERYEYFICLADKLCEPLHNYNSMLAVLSGLQSAAVTRLRYTKKGVDEEYMEKFDELLELVSSDGSYSKFRAVLKAASPPKLPLINIYLTFLTFIEDGNPNYVQSKDGKYLVNWSKRSMVCKTLLTLKDYQNSDYQMYYIPIYQIQKLLENSINQEFERGDDLYDLSLKREPRKCKLKHLVP